MERFVFVKFRNIPVNSVRLSRRNYSILHQTRAHYVKSLLGTVKCRNCGTQISTLSHLSIAKTELKAWRGILQASGILKRQQPVLYKGGHRLYSEEQRKAGDKEGPSSGAPDPLNLAFFLGWIGLIIMYMYAQSARTKKIEMSWSTFEKDYLLKGQVEKMHIVFIPSQGKQIVEVELHPDSEYRKYTGKNRLVIDVVSKEDFAEKVMEFESRHRIPEGEKISVSISKEPPYLSSLITLALIGLIVLLLRRGRAGLNKQVQDQMKFPGGASMVKDASGKNKKDVITFAQIAGQKEAMVELKEFVDYITRPLKYQKMGAKVPRGALLTGPPGCGKTLLAKALAGESKVPFYAMAGSEFIEIFGGLGASRIRGLFKKARENAPCIIYIDEIDTIGRSRKGGGEQQGGLSSETESTLNQLLVEMDGMTTTDGVIVLASTNRAEILDKALLRPGRFDRHILIDLPTLAERIELFNLYLSNIKTESVSLDKTIAKMAQMTPGMSGADIANVCNEAAIHAARNNKTVVVEEDLDYAMERVLSGVAKTNRTMQLGERRILAYHEAGHVIVKCFLEGVDKLLKVSIVPRTSDKPSFSRFKPSDRKLSSKEDLFNEMCVSLGGRVAESIVFNKITSAAEDDLRKVTKIAYHQIRTFGMCPEVGYVSFPTEEETGQRFGKKPYSKRLKTLIDREVKKMVGDAYKETEMLLKLHRLQLDKLAVELLEKESLSKEEIKKVLGFPTEDVLKREMPQNLL